MSDFTFAQRIKPSVPKRYLLLVASGVWLFAGSFLMFRGIRNIPVDGVTFWKILLSAGAGCVFFWILFLRVSTRHIHRITTLDIIRPCIFSFFDWKSYLLMVLMIGMGIAVRNLHLINDETISYFFITMSVPLIISAVRFFLAWKKYEIITKDERRKTN